MSHTTVFPPQRPGRGREREIERGQHAHKGERESRGVVDEDPDPKHLE